MSHASNALSSLLVLVNMSFTTDTLVDGDHDKIVKAISCLKETFLKCNLSITLKVHVIFCHLLDALKYSKGKKLGFLSEQCGESIHYDFSSNFGTDFKCQLTVRVILVDLSRLSQIFPPNMFEKYIFYLSIQ